MPVKGWVPKSVRQEQMKDSCEKCGSDYLLNLHHIDGNRQNNSSENLLTLCPACHTQWHWEAGKTPWRRHPAFCTVCGKPANHLGLCETHRTRFKRHGSPYLVKKKIGVSWQLVDERTGQVVSGQECRE